MKTSDFYYDLPKELIAQTPLEPRDSSRLLVLDREKQTLEHKTFFMTLLIILTRVTFLLPTIQEFCLQEFTVSKTKQVQKLNFCF